MSNSNNGYFYTEFFSSENCTGAGNVVYSEGYALDTCIKVNATTSMMQSCLHKGERIFTSREQSRLSSLRPYTGIDLILHLAISQCKLIFCELQSAKLQASPFLLECTLIHLSARVRAKRRFIPWEAAH